MVNILTRKKFAEKLHEYFVNIGKSLSSSFVNGNANTSVNSYLKGSYIN